MDLCFPSALTWKCLNHFPAPNTSHMYICSRIALKQLMKFTNKDSYYIWVNWQVVAPLSRVSHDCMLHIVRYISSDSYRQPVHISFLSFPLMLDKNKKEMLFIFRIVQKINPVTGYIVYFFLLLLSAFLFLYYH